MKIGGIEYTIIHGPLEYCGNYDYERKTITISDGTNGDVYDEILAHEILHGLLTHSGANEYLENKGADDEVVVSILSNVFYNFLRDNTDFFNKNYKL